MGHKIGLVLSRQRDERIIVRAPSGEVIVFSVVDIRGDKVRVGTLAPPGFSIDREEIDREKQAEKAVAK